MNTIDQIPITVVSQVIEGIIFTALGLPAQPLKIELAPEQFRDADLKTRKYLNELLTAMETGNPLPVPTSAWQMSVHKAVAALLAERITELLKRDGHPINDRIGRIAADYLKETNPAGTFYDYLRHGIVRPSRFGYGWIARIVHGLMPVLSKQALNSTGMLWLEGYKLSLRGTPAPDPSTLAIQN